MSAIIALIVGALVLANAFCDACDDATAKRQAREERQKRRRR